MSTGTPHPPPQQPSREVRSTLLAVRAMLREALQLSLALDARRK